MEGSQLTTHKGTVKSDSLNAHIQMGGSPDVMDATFTCAWQLACLRELFARNLRKLGDPFASYVKVAKINA
jgi:hypothetical protein